MNDAPGMFDFGLLITLLLLVLCAFCAGFFLGVFVVS